MGVLDYIPSSRTIVAFAIYLIIALVAMLIGMYAPDWVSLIFVVFMGLGLVACAPLYYYVQKAEIAGAVIDTASSMLDYANMSQ